MLVKRKNFNYHFLQLKILIKMESVYKNGHLNTTFCMKTIRNVYNFYYKKIFYLVERSIKKFEHLRGYLCVCFIEG